jgi:DNA polymerase III sliding clamp (beta) subunit (PCNA family)
VFALDARELRKALQFAKLAVATADARTYFNGVCIDLQPKRGELAHLVATDGHRLVAYPLRSIAMVAGEYDLNPSSSIIICRKALPALIKRLPRSGTVTVEAQTWVKMREVQYTYKCWWSLSIDGRFVNTVYGKFPDWSKIIPEIATHRGQPVGFTIDACPLRVAIKALLRRFQSERAAMSASDRKHHSMPLVRISASCAQPDQIAVGIEPATGEEFENWQPAGSFNGDASLSLRFNLKYLDSVTRHAKKRVRVLIDNEERPVIIEVDKHPALVLLMPLCP